MFSLRQELRLKKQSSSLIDFKLLLLFLTDIGNKNFATIPRNLIVCIKTLCFGGKIFKNLISRENNTQNAPEVLLSADILYIVFNIYADIVLHTKIRFYKGRPLATLSSIKMCVDFLLLLCFPHPFLLSYLSRRNSRKT